MVEIFFSIITRQAIRRGTYRSVKDLTARIGEFIDGWNERCQPFVWTKPAAVEILCSEQGAHILGWVWPLPRTARPRRADPSADELRRDDPRDLRRGATASSRPLASQAAMAWCRRWRLRCGTGGRTVVPGRSRVPMLRGCRSQRQAGENRPGRPAAKLPRSLGAARHRASDCRSEMELRRNQQARVPLRAGPTFPGCASRRTSRTIAMNHFHARPRLAVPRRMTGLWHRLRSARPPETLPSADTDGPWHGSTDAARTPGRDDSG
jgi:hypothetical protein